MHEDHLKRSGDSVERVNETRQRIRIGLLPEIGQVIAGETIDTIADIIWHCFGKNGTGIPSIPLEPIVTSLELWAGETLTSDNISLLSHLFAANRIRLKNYRIVRRWTNQAADELVVVQITAANKTIDQFGQAVVALQLRVLTGTPVTLLLDSRLSLSYCYAISTQLGFSAETSSRSRDPAPYPFSHPKELVSLRLNGLVEAEKSIRRPVIGKLIPDRAHRRWNKDIIKKRFRDGYDCPRELPLSFSCTDCSFGYAISAGDQRCVAACHRHPYVKKTCKRCNTEKEHDPDCLERVCVECQAKQT